MRGRKGKLPQELLNYDFAVLAKKEVHARTRQRFLALSHVKDGSTVTEVAKNFRVTRSTIHTWLRRLKFEGVDGLQEKKGRGAKQKLSTDHHEAFKKAVLELQHNRNGGRIRGEDVLKLMQEKFNVNCSIDTVYRTLSRVNLVWISGRSKHPKSDPEAQEIFKKTSQKL
jgi:transposase